MHSQTVRVLAIIAVASECILLSGQTTQKQPSFEVASVRENLIQDPRDPRYTGLTDYIPRRSGERITMHNSDLVSIVAWAYHLTNSSYQLVAGQWKKELEVSYDIEARVRGTPNDDDLRRMFQTLLEERFNWKVHQETRELPAYDLVRSRSGSPGLSPAPSRPVKNTMGFGGKSSWVELTGNGGLQLVGKGASMEELAVVLSGKMNAPVRDRTGLTGEYDYRVAFSSGVEASEAPVLSTAIHALGLNLEKSKGKFEVLVIDHLEKPSAN